jgi:hypothetical protein
MRRLSTLWRAIVVAVAVTAPSAHAQVPASRPSSVRALDPASRIFLQEGMRGSVTFRALVEAIDASDVVVYVETTTRSLTVQSAGTVFVAHTGLQRVLRTTLRVGPLWTVAVSLLGHELAHVVEVVGAPTVVDRESFGMLFRTIGVRSWCPGLATACFETAAADVAGQHVHRELSRRNVAVDAVIALTP